MLKKDFFPRQKRNGKLISNQHDMWRFHNISIHITYMWFCISGILALDSVRTGFGQAKNVQIRKSDQENNLTLKRLHEFLKNKDDIIQAEIAKTK